MLHATRRELERSFKHLMNESQKLRGTGGNNAALALMLFYAAECGLKAKLLGPNNSTMELEDRLLTHDLRELIRALRLSAERVPLADLDFEYIFQDRRPDGRAHTRVEDLHQAFRYGVRVESGHHNRAQNMLETLCRVAREELNP